jgi:hypothetical protein
VAQFPPTKSGSPAVDWGSVQNSRWSVCEGKRGAAPSAAWASARNNPDAPGCEARSGGVGGSHARAVVTW